MTMHPAAPRYRTWLEEPGAYLMMQPYAVYARALRRYARLYAHRPRGRKVKVESLTFAQIDHAGRLFRAGILVAHAHR